MPLETSRETTLIAAGWGGVLWAMVRIYTVAYAPVRPTQREILRAVVEGVFAVGSAIIAGRYVAPAIVSYYGVKDAETIGLIALVIGLLFWQSVPLFTSIALRLLPNVISRHFGVITVAKQTPPAEPKGDPE